MKNKNLVVDFSLIDPRKEWKFAALDIGETDRREHPGSGWCLRCGRTIATTSKEDTKNQQYCTVKYSNSRGMSPCCGHCWSVSTLSDRLQLAKALYRSWLSGGGLQAAFSKFVIVPEDSPEWEQIQEAVETEYKWDKETLPKGIIKEKTKKGRGTILCIDDPLPSNPQFSVSTMREIEKYVRNHWYGVRK
jgi:hypothetical protein